MHNYCIACDDGFDANMENLHCENGKLKTIMYITIGNDFTVRASSVVGIFDMDNTTINARGRSFLQKAQESGNLISCDGLPKSYIVTMEYGFCRVYESTLSAQTLQKRLQGKQKEVLR